jgi:hypothetical protein
MYKKVEGNVRMTCNEVAVNYPDNYVLVKRDDRSLYDPMCTLLYIGDDSDELFGIQVNSKIPLGLVVEGMHHRRRMGGVVVGK